ncbi:MAG: class I SAM-dependent methyltransferase [Deltaproteobacteria bacterium]|nr:class I SAM-dependent methyltransferase [Deltaproteobacteria bacterium]
MTDKSKDVQDHYTHGRLLQSIFEFLQARGVDPLHPSCDDLFKCDQIHGRGIIATREHFEYAGITSGMRVLDVGCAIGGSSRYIATACDCRVTGIDLSEEFIDAARELTKRCGLEERIEYFHANALDMPFEDTTFDHVWCHNVTMNIEDKSRLAAEIARVLKPGGRFSCAEITRGTGGEPFYPLPWASDPSSSFLVTQDEMRTILETAALRIIKQVDLTEPNMAYRREVRERAKRGEPLLSVNPMYLKYGDVFLEQGQNVNKSAEDGRLVEQLIIAEKA